jgi:hypothetical protein
VTCPCGLRGTVVVSLVSNQGVLALAPLSLRVRLLRLWALSSVGIFLVCRIMTWSR